MTDVFADTFYWVAFTNIRDTAHERAKAFMRASPPRLILTTEEVLTEYLNYFAAGGRSFDTQRRRTFKPCAPVAPSRLCRKQNIISGGPDAVSVASRQRLQPGRLYFHADDKPDSDALDPSDLRQPPHNDFLTPASAPAPHSIPQTQTNSISRIPPAPLAPDWESRPDRIPGPAR
jgi:hypothetical protein